jgi:antitoxin component YwqK of YwqJK toxin-antitoxin module
MALHACATSRTLCPHGTGLARRYYSGGGQSEYCRRPDGVRHGPEVRFYENGFELATGEHADGTVSGVWRYRFNDGRNWRADRWDDGALVSKTVDARLAGMSPAEIEALAVTSTDVIRLASADPRSYREASLHRRGSFVSHYPNGRPRAAGDYDPDGLRVGVWRYWYDDGRPAREVEYLAGVRERAAREWHPSGAPAVEGYYVAGEREGVWRWWDAQGRLTGEATYKDGARTDTSRPPPSPPPPTPPSRPEPEGEPPIRDAGAAAARDGGMLRG